MKIENFLFTTCKNLQDFAYILQIIHSIFRDIATKQQNLASILALV